MIRIETIAEMQRWALEKKRQSKKIAFVPTMGFLHEGHLQLIRRARACADEVVVSIFVNPLQFGPQEDFQRYPRDVESDAGKVKDAGADVLFLPRTEEFYPRGFQTKIVPGALAEELCGRLRPGHFAGVATVVAKLFNAVQPDTAVFGEKDFQQLQVVKRMTRDLNYPVEIIAAPTVRNAKGLALSSRNQYLSDAEVQAALIISRTLEGAAEKVNTSRLSAEEISRFVYSAFAQEKNIQKIDYVSIVDPEELTPLTHVGGGTRGLLAVALWIAGVRLIDNRLLG